ncbi:unnamed protein product [Mucor hiemalis]
MTVKNIVLVGGGFAGIGTANALEKALLKSNDQDHRIILVEKKSHFYHAIAGLRSAVLDWDNKIMIPYTHLFQNKKNIVVQASAIQLEANKLVLDQSVPEFGETIDFDYLVIATGTQYPAPAKATALDYDTTRANLVSLRSEIKSSQSIVIVGGGPVGIELAGEIREIYPKTKITIVHDQSTFVSELPKISQKLVDLTVKNKVDTLFNDAVIVPPALKNNYYHPEAKTVETKNGKSIENVDLVLLAFGNRPETAWFKNTRVGSEIVADNGYIKVKKTFQVDHPELSNVFVLGDAANFNETKLAYRIGTHVPVVVQNIVQMAVKNKQPQAEYKKAPDAMFVTFGKKQGVGLLPLFGGIAVGGWAVGTLKGGSLFTSKSWETLNLKEPTTTSI